MSNKPPSSDPLDTNLGQKQQLSVDKTEVPSSVVCGQTELLPVNATTHVALSTCLNTPIKPSSSINSVTVSTEVAATNHVLMLQDGDTSEITALPVELGAADFNNFHIILDMDGRQVLLSNDDSGEGQEVLRELQITEASEVTELVRNAGTQKKDDTMAVLHATLGSRDTLTAPVLFQVRAEDGTFHNVNMDVERNQTEKVSISTGGVDSGESTGNVVMGPGGEERPFQCDLCSATFTRLGNYTRHRMIHTIHIKEDCRYKCEVCERMFLQRCDLKRHALIHEGNLPYKCEHCGKGYVRKSDLVVHVRFHKNERSFPCPQCSKAFFQSGDLQRHIRHVHQHIKPMTCGHCQRKYSKESTLIRHMQTVHRDIILNSLTSKGIQPMEESVHKEDGVYGAAVQSPKPLIPVNKK